MDKETKGYLREFLVEQGVWEREADELLGSFSDDVTEVQ